MTQWKHSNIRHVKLAKIGSLFALQEKHHTSLPCVINLAEYSTNATARIFIFQRILTTSSAGLFLFFLYTPFFGTLSSERGGW